MSVVLLQYVLPLLAAHFLGDFIFQTDKDVKNKKNTVLFIKHISAITILSYLLLGNWKMFLIPVIILFTHTLIDLIKRSIKKDSMIVFFLDQAAHLLVILIISAYMNNTAADHSVNSFWYNALGSFYFKALLIIIAAVLLTKFSSIIINFIIKPFQAKILMSENNNNEEIKTGRLIGYLERIIIMILFLAEMPAVVGFLITAKSILRYGEIKSVKDKVMVEYILIGTLLSFALGIGISFLTTKVLNSLT